MNMMNSAASSAWTIKALVSPICSSAPPNTMVVVAGMSWVATHSFSCSTFWSAGTSGTRLAATDIW